MKLPTFAGLNIAPGNLYYSGGDYHIAEDWNHDSYSTNKTGVTEGSYYFGYSEVGASSRVVSGFGYSDWRFPTKSELQAIAGTSRIGSTVNGVSGRCFALVQLTGITHAGSSTPIGMIVFPDGATITGKSLSYTNNNSMTTGFTESDLNVYLSQGCAFLPGSGIKDMKGRWYLNRGYYISSNAKGYLLFFSGYLQFPNDGENSDKMTARLVRTA